MLFWKFNVLYCGWMKYAVEVRVFPGFEKEVEPTLILIDLAFRIQSADVRMNVVEMMEPPQLLMVGLLLYDTWMLACHGNWLRLSCWPPTILD